MLLKLQSIFWFHEMLCMVSGIWHLPRSYNLVCSENKSLRTKILKVAYYNAHRSIQRCKVFIDRHGVNTLKKGVFTGNNLTGIASHFAMQFL